MYQELGVGVVEDNTLLERARSGDSGAFAELMVPHLPVARRVAARTLGSEAAADDVVQSALVKAYGSLGRFDAQRALRPWFLTIVRNEARNHGRSARRRGSAEARLSAQPEADASPPAEDEVLGAFDRAELLAAVDRKSVV